MRITVRVVGLAALLAITSLQQPPVSRAQNSHSGGPMAACCGRNPGMACCNNAGMRCCHFRTHPNGPKHH